jgi:hypothetical protein
MTDPEIIDLLERLRNGYIRALEFTKLDLPTSAATEELAATRLANRAILELNHNQKKKKLC